MAVGEQGLTRATTSDVWAFLSPFRDEAYEAEKDLRNSVIGAAMLADGERTLDEDPPTYQRISALANEYRELFAVGLIDTMSVFGEVPTGDLNEEQQEKAAKIGAVLAAYDLVVMIDKQTLPQTTTSE